MTAGLVHPAASVDSAAFDANLIRAQFPILATEVDGKPLAYLDSASTTQKPQCVIDAVADYYSKHNANVHRGVYRLSLEATELYEGARTKVQRMINAADSREVIFTAGTTCSVNLVAHSWGLQNLKRGDEVLITGMEHHSNIVPWQLVCERVGARVRAVPITDAGELDMDALDSLLTERTKMVAVVHASNTLGTINPVKEIVARAHDAGALVLVDGAQSLQHMDIDVQEIGCDFYASSSHKMFGPTGIGFLHGRYELLDDMPPWLGGGDMIRTVSLERSTFAGLPNKFEAGTPNIAGAAGFGAAIDFVQSCDMDAVREYEHELLRRATDALNEIEGVRIIGEAKNKASVISFVVEGVHPHDLGTIFDSENVAIRTGHHCTQPLMDRFGVPATARASMAMYNTIDDIEALVHATRKAIEVFA